MVLSVLTRSITYMNCISFHQGKKNILLISKCYCLLGHGSQFKCTNFFLSQRQVNENRGGIAFVL
jgi:hypothetical protein